MKRCAAVVAAVAAAPDRNWLADNTPATRGFSHDIIQPLGEINVIARPALRHCFTDDDIVGPSATRDKAQPFKARDRSASP